MKKTIAILTILVSIILLSSTSQAEVKKRTQGDKNGYGYEFDDDPLNAGGWSSNDAIIKIRPRAARTTLIRPRTSFVQEMLKSVESL